MRHTHPINEDRHAVFRAEYPIATEAQIAALVRAEAEIDRLSPPFKVPLTKLVREPGIGFLVCDADETVGERRAA
jgi:hypothetical protein